MKKSDWAEKRMEAKLQQRREKGTLRRLPAASVQDQSTSDTRSSTTTNVPIDFSSNDYLGLSQSLAQAKRVQQLYDEADSSCPTSSNPRTLGATGSRLLSGDTAAAHQLEAYLAALHQQPAALLCNSGYDANLCVVSSLACDVIIYDEYSHNSLHMAMRFWQSRQDNNRTLVGFRHNDMKELQDKLDMHCRNDAAVVVVVESVYSMDGDCAPLGQVLDQASAHGARVVVDEAHGLGACGPTGLLAALGLHHHPALLATVYTFGKAAGCHGAVITGSRTLKEYLVNFAYPFIYSTALPRHSLCTIRASYETMTSSVGDSLRARLQHHIQFFQREMQSKVKVHPEWQVSLIPSTTAIQALVVPGNDRCSQFCEKIWQASNRQVRLFPIKSPTVPAGMERVRVVLHAHNTKEEIQMLIHLLCSCLEEEQSRMRSKL